MLRRVFVILAAALLVTSPAIAGADETAPGLIADGRVDEAIAALRGQITTSPNDALAHNLLCRAYFSLADWDRGISACEKAVALAPQNSQFHLWLGRIYGEKADKSGFMTAAGLEEIHLRPGSYKVHADKDGKRLPLERELISIAKGGREVVRVKLEAAPVAPE